MKSSVTPKRGISMTNTEKKVSKKEAQEELVASVTSLTYSVEEEVAVAMTTVRER